MHESHNHKINRILTTQDFVNEVKNPLNTLKGKITRRQPNPKNHYNEEDPKYRQRNL